MTTHGRPDNFGAYLGYRIIAPSEKDGMPTYEMTIEEKHLSNAGVSHGGAVFSLVDYAMGATTQICFTEAGERCSTVGMAIEYLRPVPLGTRLAVTVYMEHRGRSLVRLRADIHDQEGTKLAFATGTFNIYRRRKSE